MTKPKPKLKPWYKQRKFILAIVAALVMVANATFDLELETEQIISILAPIIAWILGEAYVDANK